MGLIFLSFQNALRKLDNSKLLDIIEQMFNKFYWHFENHFKSGGVIVA